jgi:hypothetical protein
MTDYGVPVQHEQTDRLLTTFIDTYNSIFPSRQSFDPWTDLWAKDAEWTLPIDRKSSAHGGIEVSANLLYGFEQFNLQSVQSGHVKMTFEREGQHDPLLRRSS